MTDACPQSPDRKPCLFAPHRMGTSQRLVVVCMLCGAPKPAEPCYFAEQGDAARRLMEEAK